MVCLFPLIFLAFGTLFCFRINRPYYFNLSGAPAVSGCSPCAGARSWLCVLPKILHPAPAKVLTALSRIISHLLQAPLPWQHSTFVSLPTTIMPRSFFIDLFLVVPFLVIAIDCCSLRVALCIHCSCHSLFPDDFIRFQVHSAFQSRFPVYQICRF